MCELEGVANLGQLGAHDPAAQVPLLGRILRIEQMSTAFVGSYIAQRSIVTLRDMEKELVTFLRSYNLQPRTEISSGVTRIAPDLATNRRKSPSTNPTSARRRRRERRRRERSRRLSMHGRRIPRGPPRRRRGVRPALRHPR